MKLPRNLLPTVVILGLAACALIVSCTSPTKSDDHNMTTPVLRLSVEAQPPTIHADGLSRMVIFTELRQDDTAVADSTEIILLNTIGTLKEGIIHTHGGVALDTLTSDTVAGMGWIIAYSKGIRDSVEVMFTDN